MEPTLFRTRILARGCFGRWGPPGVGTDLLRYRCHTGHAFSAGTMDLARRMVARALERGHHHTAELWQGRAEEHDRQADVLMSLLLQGEAGRHA